jgi:hypothetical protein
MSDEEISTKGIDHKKLAPILETLKKRVFSSDVVKDMFDKYGIDEGELNLIPFCWAKIPVSGRTDHGIIYINVDLLDDFLNGNEGIADIVKEVDHYLAHEITHFAQQTTGDKPTPGSNDCNYLDNPAEQEGFRTQTKYISETQGDEQAEDYIDKVIDHHSNGDDDSRMEKRREKLLDLAMDLKLNILKLA